MLNPPRVGEIWNALVPDPSGKYYKVRPCLVLRCIFNDDHEFDGCYILGITRSIQGKPLEEFILKPDNTNNLVKDSAVQYCWVELVPASKLRGKRGSVSKERFDAIAKGLNQFIEAKSGGHSSSI